MEIGSPNWNLANDVATRCNYLLVNLRADESLEKIYMEEKIGGLEEEKEERKEKKKRNKNYMTYLLVYG